MERGLWRRQRAALGEFYDVADAADIPEAARLASTTAAGRPRCSPTTAATDCPTHAPRPSLSGALETVSSTWLTEAA
jgi:hypothetical protein